MKVLRVMGALLVLAVLTATALAAEAEPGRAAA